MGSIAVRSGFGQEDRWTDSAVPAGREGHAAAQPTPPAGQQIPACGFQPRFVEYPFRYRLMNCGVGRN